MNFNGGAMQPLNPHEFNAFCRSLIATSHVVQWSGSDVWKVGGKVFAIGSWDGSHPGVTFKVSPLAFEMLQQMPGFRPAPYLASRGLTWIQQFSPIGPDGSVLQDYLRESHRLVACRLSIKRRRELGLEI
jgi:predicted DNA-binding protein (MmcQ/YjbR family)